MLGQLWGICRYEFRMQLRKRSLWISTVLLLTFAVVTQGDRGPRHVPMEATAREVMGNWTVLFWIMLPLVFGVVLADRVVRDRRLGVRGLLLGLPVGEGRLLAGKYLGGIAATGLPGLLALLAAAGYEAVHRGTIATFEWALVGFLTVMLPGLAFVAGFALVCPLLVSAPLFRVLFVGYWFWGNLTAPRFLPSLTGTLLTPVGAYPASWLLGEPVMHAGVPGWLAMLRPEPTGAAALGSVALLLVIGVLPLVVTVLLRKEGRA